jgi:hypothetical protein
MYRADGPVEMKPVGETEFVNGTAAMSASGQYGPARLCRGIEPHSIKTVTRLFETGGAGSRGQFSAPRPEVR